QSPEQGCRQFVIPWDFQKLRDFRRDFACIDGELGERVVSGDSLTIRRDHINGRDFFPYVLVCLFLQISCEGFALTRKRRSIMFLLVERLESKSRFFVDGGSCQLLDLRTISSCRCDRFLVWLWWIHQQIEKALSPAFVQRQNFVLANRIQCCLFHRHTHEI